jgi:hypothetical protein
MCMNCETNLNDWGSLESEFLSGVDSKPDFLSHAANFAQNAPAPFRAEKVKRPVRTEPCGRCGGSGVFRPFGTCFKCNGTRVQRAKIQDVSPEGEARRAKLHERRMAKEAQERAEAEARRQSHWTAFASSYVAVAQWIERGCSQGRDFPLSLRGGVEKFGGLTPNQLAAVERILAQDAEKAKTAVNVAGAGYGALLKAFANAVGHKLKWPKIRVQGLVFSLAGASSANAGCLYVKAGETYIGKVSPTGQFFRGRDCRTEDLQLVEQVGKDPLAALVAHGHQTGSCGICGRELTDPTSVERGISPICAEKYGF